VSQFGPDSAAGGPPGDHARQARSPCARHRTPTGAADPILLSVPAQLPAVSAVFTGQRSILAFSHARRPPQV